ncbi:hypothetical protein ACJZ2D_002171 [Fusarium nematophilum]
MASLTAIPAELKDVVLSQLSPQNQPPLLRGMNALTDLDISFPLLYGQIHPKDAQPLAEVLPPSLKRLTINDDLWHYDAFYEWQGEPPMALLRTFLDGGWRTATPELTEFELDKMGNGWIWYDDDGQQPLGQLEDICKRRGLKCLIRQTQT